MLLIIQGPTVHGNTGYSAHYSDDIGPVLSINLVINLRINLVTNIVNVVLVLITVHASKCSGLIFSCHKNEKKVLLMRPTYIANIPVS